MVSRKTRTIKGSLENKGFKQSISDHYWYVLYIDKKKTSIRTKVSFGINEYGDDLLSKMSHQLKISKKELEGLIDCPLSGEEYISILKNKKIIIE